MYGLPTNEDEFILWKLSGTTLRPELIWNNDVIWEWIIQYGAPLFSKHVRLRIATDAGHGAETHIIFFDKQIISVTSSYEIIGNDFHKVEMLFQHFTCDVPTEYVTI